MGNPELLPPEIAEIAERMEGAGLAPEVEVLKTLIAEFPRKLAQARAEIDELRREAVQRAVVWPLGALLPVHVSDETGRVAAVRGELVATQTHKGAPWFVACGEVEIWLRRSGRWFTSDAAEARWRAAIRFRTRKD